MWGDMIRTWSLSRCKHFPMGRSVTKARERGLNSPFPRKRRRLGGKRRRSKCKDCKKLGNNAQPNLSRDSLPDLCSVLSRRKCSSSCVRSEAKTETSKSWLQPALLLPLCSLEEKASKIKVRVRGQRERKRERKEGKTHSSSYFFNSKRVGERGSCSSVSISIVTGVVRASIVTAALLCRIQGKAEVER